MDEQGDRPIIILLQAGIEIARFLIGLLLVLFAMFAVVAVAVFLGWNFELSGGVVAGSFVILIAVRLIGNRDDPRHAKRPLDPP